MTLRRDTDKARQFARQRSQLRRTGKLRHDARTDDERWDEEQVRLAVYDRDRGCRMAGLRASPCAGPRTPHHRRKAGAGGAYSLENLVELCAFHNGLVEDEPDWARELYPELVVREGDPEWEQLGARAHRLAQRRHP